MKMSCDRGNRVLAFDKICYKTNWRPKVLKIDVFDYPLHCRLTPPLHGTPGKFRTDLILPESRVIGPDSMGLLFFIQIFVCLTKT